MDRKYTHTHIKYGLKNTIKKVQVLSKKLNLKTKLNKKRNET